MTLNGGADSQLWQLMKKRDIDLYLCGEVHDITAKEQDGIEHLAHGALFGYNNKVNYLVMTVTPQRIHLELKRIDIVRCVLNSYRVGYLAARTAASACDVKSAAVIFTAFRMTEGVHLAVFITDDHQPIRKRRR